MTDLKSPRTWIRAAGEVALRVIGVALGIAIADHFFHFLGH